MLRSLHVKDFAVVSASELEFGPGMTAITGETGAGKSLLVDALMMLCGARADAGMVRHGQERAELSAEFTLPDDAPAMRWLREQELDDDGQCQIRRVLRADGGSRAWINSRSATANQLQALGALLVGIHGQNEHQSLHARAAQLDLLDAFGGHEALRRAVAEQARQHAEVRQQLDALSRQGQAPEERLAWLEYQLQELDAAVLSADALDALQAEEQRLAHASDLIEGSDQAIARLDGEDEFALRAQLRRLQAVLQGLVPLDPGFEEALALVDAAGIQLDEASASLARARDRLELDPERLAEVRGQLDRLHDLARKHRVPLPQLAERAAELRDERDQLRDADAVAAGLRVRLATLQQAWAVAADRLGAARRDTAQRLSDGVTALLGELGMSGGRFAVQLDVDEDAPPSPTGRERCEFLVAANPGQPPGPLRRIASGGELSRISLAIEVVALGADPVPTLVFDEVDTGISGAVAEVVGQRLRALGSACQVLCVTHLPQVAVQGHVQFQVSKQVVGAQTESRVERLDGERRVEAIASMLAGARIDDAARAHARNLLARAAD